MITSGQLAAAAGAVAVTQGSLALLMPNLHDATTVAAPQTVRIGLIGATGVGLVAGLAVLHVSHTPAGLIGAGALLALTAAAYASAAHTPPAA